MNRPSSPRRVSFVVAAFGSLLLAATALAQDKNFQVFLCLGQSNMEGFPGIQAEDKGPVDERFQVLAAVDFPALGRTKGNWYNAVPPLCRPNTGLCPADYFGRTLVAKLPADIKVGVINVSVAGAKIEVFDEGSYQAYMEKAEDWKKRIVAAYGGNPYRHLVELAKTAQKSGVIKGILLHQGESNNGDQEWPNKVKVLYERLLKDLDLRAEEVPLLVGELVGADQHGACAGMNAIIRDLPKTIPTAHVVSSAGCVARPDHLHFTPEGYRELGKRFGEEMLPLLAVKTAAATTPPAGGGGRRGGPPVDLGPLPEIHAAVPNTLPGLLGKPLQWVSTAPLVVPVNDDTHTVQSIKDPTIAFIDGKWEIYATAHLTSPVSKNTFNMVHLSFADWKDAPKAPLFYMDNNPNFTGYKCAPELFYFAPQKKWYFTFQTQPPVFCTSETPGDPNSWTKPERFFAAGTPMPRLPIDYHFIGDGEHMYLFFTGDDGNFYRSRTTYAEFPQGFGKPVVAMRGTRNTVFEAGFTYKIKGADKYLTLVEALPGVPGGGRYYRAYVADKLDGEWYPVEGFDTLEKPFAGKANLSFEPGVEPWSGQVSHGELVRTTNDERMVLDPDNLLFLYQGISDAENKGDYGALPYKLGLLRAKRAN